MNTTTAQSTQRGLNLQYFTIAYNVLEAIIALAAWTAYESL